MQLGRWGSCSHKNTDSAHRAKGFLSQQVPTPMWECRGCLGNRGLGQPVLPWDMAW